MKTIKTLNIDASNPNFEKFFVETDKHRITVEPFTACKTVDRYKLSNQSKENPANSSATIGSMEDTIRVLSFLLDETRGEYVYSLNKYNTGETHITL